MSDENKAEHILTAGCDFYNQDFQTIPKRGACKGAFTYGVTGQDQCQLYSKVTYVDEHGLKYITNYTASGNGCTVPYRQIQTMTYEGSYTKTTTYSKNIDHANAQWCNANGSTTETWAINDKGVVKRTNLSCGGSSSYHRSVEDGRYTFDCTANVSKVSGPSGPESDYCQWAGHTDVNGNDGDTDFSQSYDFVNETCCEIIATEEFNPPLQEPYTLYENPISVINYDCCDCAGDLSPTAYGVVTNPPCEAGYLDNYIANNMDTAYNFNIEARNIVNDRTFKYRITHDATRTCYLKIWCRKVIQHYQLQGDPSCLNSYLRWSRYDTNWILIPNTYEQFTYVWDKRGGGCPSPSPLYTPSNTKITGQWEEITAGLGTTVTIEAYKGTTRTDFTPDDPTWLTW